MIKGFRQIALLTTISRILGMIRDMAFAYFLGAAGVMNGWVIAFMIPNLARRLFGEGAASSSFIPVYSEQLQKNPKDAKRLACTVVTVIFVLLAAIVIVGELGIWAYYSFFSVYESTNLKLSLMGIMLPYMVMICTVAILAGILNAHRHFATPAMAPIVLNIFIIGSLFLGGSVIGLEAKQLVFVVAFAVLIAGIVQIMIQIRPLRQSGILIRPAWDIHSQAFKKIIIMMAPMILGLTVTQLNTLADVCIATWFSGSAEKGQFFMLFARQIQYPLWDGAVSQLYFSQRLYQFPLGVLGIALATSIFPVMSSNAAKKDFDTLQRTVSRGIKGAIFIAIPASLGLILIARPLVSVVFEHGRFTATDTSLTAGILLFYAIGLTGFFSQQIVTRAFYSMQDSKTPMRSALLAVFTNIVLNLTFIWWLGSAGLALSTAICSYLQVVILVILLRRRLGRSLLDGLAVTFFKTIAAAVVMCLTGVAILFAMAKLAPGGWFDGLRLLAVVPSAAVVYALMAKILRIEMLSLVTGGQTD